MGPNRDMPPSAIDTLQRIAAAYGRVGATRIYRPNIAAAIAAGATGQPVPVRIRRTGTLIALYGTTLGATAAEAAGLEVKIEFSGSESICTDGEDAAFMSFRALFGDAANWFALNRRMREGQILSSTFKNVTAAPITPSLYYAILEDQIEG